MGAGGESTADQWLQRQQQFGKEENKGETGPWLVARVLSKTWRAADAASHGPVGAARLELCWPRPTAAAAAAAFVVCVRTAEAGHRALPRISYPRLSCVSVCVSVCACVRVCVKTGPRLEHRDRAATTETTTTPDKRTPRLCL